MAHLISSLNRLWKDIERKERGKEHRQETNQRHSLQDHNHILLKKKKNEKEKEKETNTLKTVRTACTPVKTLKRWTNVILTSHKHIYAFLTSVLHKRLFKTCCFGSKSIFKTLQSLRSFKIYCTRLGLRSGPVLFPH